MQHKTAEHMVLLQHKLQPQEVGKGVIIIIIDFNHDAYHNTPAATLDTLCHIHNSQYPAFELSPAPQGDEQLYYSRAENVQGDALCLSATRD
jgi:hypothetical protein